MQTVSPHLAKTLITQVMSLLGRDASLANSQGELIASYDPNLAGTMMSGVAACLEKAEVAELEGGAAVVIPLRQDGDTVAGLILHSDLAHIKDVVPVTKSFAELLLEQEAQHRVTESLDQVLWQFFHSLSDAERERLVDEAKLLGIDLSKQRFVALIEVPDFQDKLAPAADKNEPITRFKEKLTREITSLFPSSSDNTVTYFGYNTFLILKDAARNDETLELFRQKADQMMANLGSGITVGIGGLHLGIEGLLTSYREAAAALRLGSKLYEPGKSYYIDDIGLNIVFAELDLDKQVQLAKRALAPMLKDSDLTKTLRGYFDHSLNLTNASKALHIHRNTLIYRLGKIRELVGLDPETFDDAVQLKIALTLLDLE